MRKILCETFTLVHCSSLNAAHPTAPHALIAKHKALGALKISHSNQAAKSLPTQRLYSLRRAEES